MIRRTGRTSLLLTALLTVGCSASDGPNPSGAADATTLPFPDDPDLWPSIRQERIRTLLGPAMARAGIEAWVVMVQSCDSGSSVRMK